MFDIEKIVKCLSKKRNIFHSEADFQFALAWEIKEICGSTVDLRLELPFRQSGERVKYIDIVVVHSGQLIPIELKYATEICVFDEYQLTKQGAKDIKLYDFCKDIERVEHYINNHDNCKEGYCIFLTNDFTYSRDSGRQSGSMEFHIFEGAVKTGVLDWGDGIGTGTMKGREIPIMLSNSYTMRWQPYSQVPSKSYGKFIYNIVEVMKITK